MAGDLMSNPELTEEEDQKIREIFSYLRSLLKKGMLYNEKVQNPEEDIKGATLQQILHPNGEEALLYVAAKPFTLEVIAYFTFVFDRLFEDPIEGVNRLLEIRKIMQDANQKEKDNEELRNL